MNSSVDVTSAVYMPAVYMPGTVQGGYYREAIQGGRYLVGIVGMYPPGILLLFLVYYSSHR